jgi:hypothetical protein
MDLSGMPDTTGFSLCEKGFGKICGLGFGAHFFFLCEVFFSRFSISFFFVLYVSKKERMRQCKKKFLDSDLASAELALWRCY